MSNLRDDPLQSQRRLTLPAERLVEISQRINSMGESATDKTIFLACRNWITRFFPNTRRRLAKLKDELENVSDRRFSYRGEDDVDTIEDLATRLQFALTITLLDRHTKIVFYEWQIDHPQLGKRHPIVECLRQC